MHAHLRPSLHAVVSIILLVGLSPLTAARAQDSSRLFPETGKTVSGRFLQYWDEHGGLAQQGYPISGEMQERSDTDGKTYTVQYFERAVFEAHPENQAPYDVLLALLGTLLYREKYANGVPGSPQARTLPADKAPAASCPPTFADDQSPTYKPDMPVRNSVGKGHVVTGYVLSGEGCRPVAGAKLEMWPEVGNGHPDEYRATLFTDKDGRYRFESPVSDHIHMRISAHGYTAIFSNAYHLEAGQPQGTFDVVLRPDPACDLYEATGHAVCGAFLEYWKSHGGLAQQGYPISGALTEVSDLNGQPYTVQYFERAVFEAHPENQAPYDVLLSQLGRFRYRDTYVRQVPSDLAVPVPSTISPQALAYLREALDFAQMNFVGREKFDWIELRRQAFDLAKDAQTPVDTYPAIEMVLSTLRDVHSRFRRPGDVSSVGSAAGQVGVLVWYQDGIVTKVDPGSLGDRAGVRVGDVVKLINGTPLEGMGASQFFFQLYGGVSVNLTLEREGHSEPLQVTIEHDFIPDTLIPSGRRLAGDIGYLKVPSSALLEVEAGPRHNTFGSIGQQIIRDIDGTGGRPIRGWVVDLQSNTGGSLSSMILAVDPILGDGHLGGFVDMSGEVTRWELDDGQLRYVNQDEQQQRVEQIAGWVENPYVLRQPASPVAILTSEGTASAGEATLIAFRGRADVRTFGQPTRGVPNASAGKIMSDGAIVQVSSQLEMDRTGHIYGYDERIAPDEVVATNPRLVGTDSDPVLQVGMQWLNSMLEASR
jgi:carboxyl-terminal processing protease